MNKLVYLGLSVLDISKTAMYEIEYDYIKTRYIEKPKSCYMDVDRFIACIKAKDTYKDISKDFNKRFDTSK